MSKALTTAISLGSRTLDWARLERVRGAWRAVASNTLEIPPVPQVSGAAEEERAPVVDFGRVLAAAVPERVTLCVESSLALFRSLVLPTTVASEVPGMVSLQMDKVLPLPAEEMSLAIETLSTDDVNTTVIACAVPTAALAAAAAGIGLSHGRIRRIDVAALACLQLLSEAEQVLDAGRETFLLDEGSLITLMVLEAGLPVLIRTVASLDGNPEDIARSVRLSLVQVEVERGPMPLARSTLVSAHAASANLLRTLSAGLGCDVRTLVPEDLGLLSRGAAVRTASRCGFDLMPQGWSSSLSERRFRRGLLRIAGGTVLVWSLFAAALFGGPSLLDRRAATLQESLAALAPSSRLVQDVRHRVRMIQTYMDREESPLETLREISRLLPEGIELSSFRYRREDRRLSVQGSSRSTPLVYEFKRRVDGSELFGESALVSGPTTNPRTGGADFELLILFREDEP